MFYADNYCTYTEDMSHYIYTGRCVVTRKETTVRIPKSELYAYRQGAKIQDAMPSLSKDEREFLMSGHSKEGWDAIFKDD